MRSLRHWPLAAGLATTLFASTALADDPKSARCLVTGTPCIGPVVSMIQLFSHRGYRVIPAVPVYLGVSQSDFHLVLLVVSF